MKRQLYTGIITHPYITRKKQYCLFVYNATADSADAVIKLLDVAEKLCICSNEDFVKLLPMFEEFYSMVSDVEAEIKFIKEQRQKRCL